MLMRGLSVENPSCGVPIVGLGQGSRNTHVGQISWSMNSKQD
jgi:hypothetical protein